MSEKAVRTTISLPEGLVRRADLVVGEGAVGSRNELVISALEREVERLERERLDAEFAGMADDEEYLRQAEGLAEEFAVSDRETLSEPGGSGPGAGA